MCHGQTVMDTSLLSGLMIMKRVMVKLLWTPTSLLCGLMTPSEPCQCSDRFRRSALAGWREGDVGPVGEMGNIDRSHAGLNTQLSVAVW